MSKVFRVERNKNFTVMANYHLKDNVAAIDEFCRLLAVQIYNIQAFADPERIVIGGGISAQPLLFKILGKHLDRIFEAEAPYNVPIAKPEIVPCKYRNTANLIGALYAFLENRKACLDMVK